MYQETTHPRVLLIHFGVIGITNYIQGTHVTLRTQKGIAARRRFIQYNAYVPENWVSWRM